MTRNLDKRSGRSAFRRRLGFTMIEIMTSVTLSLMLMYAVARIFSRVGGTMNETTSIMQATNSLRNAKNRLTADLEGITVDPVPPRNSRLGDGYLCYVEGMGAPLNRLYNGNYNNSPDVFSTACVALDPERYQKYHVHEGSADASDWVDTTVGDVDDVLSFTSRAPVGQQFRGRYIRPIYDVNGNIVDGKPDTFESEFAEIVWFVRGTTLYRRVLPILSNERLQESLDALVIAADSLGGWDPSLTMTNQEQAAELRAFGCGFFRYYDVSVHLNANGNIVANTLGDLTNRANRYGYWNPVDSAMIGKPAALSIHGNVNAASGASQAWYWLRMPTLQECVQRSFRAGAPFGDGRYAAFQVPNPDWQGPDQVLSYTQESTDESPLTSGSYSASALPVGNSLAPTPFIDFWNTANIWDQVNHETGDLSVANSENVFNQDVMLTNVLSFNVKAWDPDVNDYIDLGYNLSDPTANHADPNDLCSGGSYLWRRYSFLPDSDGNPYTQDQGRDNAGNTIPTPSLTYFPMPCVYDTWSEQYQRDLYVYDQNNGTNLASGSISDISLDGPITSAQLPDYPPPYNVALKSLQIEIRVFDPRSKQIRNVNFIVDLTK